MTSTGHSRTLKLRLGVVLLFLFWAPFWMLSPVIARQNGANVASVTAAIMILQAVLGLLGALLVGGQVVALLKQSSKRKVPGKIWHMFWRGTSNLDG